MAILVCQTPMLTQLDDNLAKVYEKASMKAKDLTVLRRNQDDWEKKDRDECWKADDKTLCVQQSYRHRIAELQAQYVLIKPQRELAAVCDGNPGNNLKLQYFNTHPAALAVQRHNQRAVLFKKSVASGSLYQNSQISISEQAHQLAVVWGSGAQAVHCITKNASH
ncbi:lysozyme inhibitor LprI family protein [Gallaecimonas mangrovi]|uniref:lysozyme inhibitor LprI family protein n=1 Tax=Gallaecimonas mangrovi TaxID=2291597 RepID=UPI001866ABAB|nr:hypothetical protein [Gallaecimonas mangrovi]